MITFYKTSKYQRERDKYLRHNLPRVSQVYKTLKTFQDNPKSGGLNIEKLSEKVYSMRLNKGDRIFFSWIDNTTVLLLDIGKHDKYRKY